MILRIAHTAAGKRLPWKPEYINEYHTIDFSFTFGNVKLYLQFLVLYALHFRFFLPLSSSTQFERWRFFRRLLSLPLQYFKERNSFGMHEFEYVKRNRMNKKKKTMSMIVNIPGFHEIPHERCELFACVFAHSFDQGKKNCLNFILLRNSNTCNGNTSTFSYYLLDEF